MGNILDDLANALHRAQYGVQEAIANLEEILEEVRHGDCDRDVISTAAVAALRALGVEAGGE